ncbi:unnamed protein product [Lota lota]
MLGPTPVTAGIKSCKGRKWRAWDPVDMDMSWLSEHLCPHGELQKRTRPQNQNIRRIYVPQTESRELTWARGTSFSDKP